LEILYTGSRIKNAGEIPREEKALSPVFEERAVAVRNVY